MNTTPLTLSVDLLVLPESFPGALYCLHELLGLAGRTCTGVLLLAETGLLDGSEAIHWAFAPTFRRNFRRCGCAPRRC